MKALIFDLDETLIDRSQTMSLFLRYQYERFSELGSISVDDFVDTVLEHQKNGYEDKCVAYRRSCVDFFDSGDLADELFLDFKDKYGFEAVLFRGVKEVLERLSDIYTLGIVTNGRSRCQNAKIDYVGIRSLFQSIVISEELGVKKPDKRIFEACLSELSVEPSNCICIGDNPKNDLSPAKDIGMKTIWIRNSNFEHPNTCDAYIESVADIEAALTNLLA